MPEDKPTKPLSAFAQALQSKNKSTKSYKPKEEVTSSVAPIYESMIMDPRVEELRVLAEEAVKTADASREASVKATIAKSALYKLMKEYGVEQIPIPGRGPARIITGSGKKTLTKGALLKVLGPEVGEQTWKDLPVGEGKESLQIPSADNAEGNTEE